MSFLGGILRVWGLGPGQHWVGLYWDHWECTGICAGSALDLQWEHWELWQLYWENTGSSGACTEVCTGAALRATAHILGGAYWEHWEYPCGPHRESCSLGLAVYWKH